MDKCSVCGCETLRITDYGYTCPECKTAFTITQEKLDFIDGKQGTLLYDDQVDICEMFD